MADIYKENIVDIDLAKGKLHREFLPQSIGTADNSADRFGIRVFRNGEEVDLSGCSCYGFFRDPQGNPIALTSYGTIDGNLAYVTLPQACYNYEGQFTLSIKLIGGGVTGTMRIIDGVVDNTNTGGAVAPTGAVPTYSEVLSQYDAMVAATAAANGCIAETFDATNAYKDGQYVINSGALYRLTADHAANVTWANTSKVEVKFGNELSDVKSAITQATRNLFDKYNPNSMDATFASYSGTYKIVSNANNKMIIIPVESGQTYTISKMSSGRFRYGTFAALPAIDASMIQIQTNNDSATKKTVTIDANANYLAVLYYNSTVDTTSDKTPEKILDTLQIEKGSDATEYIPHLSAADYIVREESSANKVGMENVEGTLEEITSRTKNLFDWRNANIFEGNIAKSGNNYILTTGDYKLFYMPITPNKWYTVQKIASYRFRYGTTTNTPEIGDALIDYSIANDDATAKSINSNANYLVVMYYSPENDTLSEETILKSIMVEEGQNATEYMPYYTAKDEVARQTIANSVGGNLFAMFDNLTCIGDSLTYSEVFTGATAHRQAKRTYPDVLAALSGNTAENLGLMGDSASDWWGHKSSEIVAKTNQLFIVYLGTNGGLTDTIDTDCPGTNIANFASNNTGCYGKILQTISNLGDRAVLVHIYGGGGDSGVDGTNAVIDKFGLKYGFAVLKNEKLLDECYHIYPDRTGMNNLHYNDLGYAVFAGRMIAQINALEPTDAAKLVPHD